MFVAASRNRSDSCSRANPTPPSYVKARRARVRMGARTLVRRGCRRVPENLPMDDHLAGLLMETVRSGNRVNERECRFERQASRPFTNEERPLVAADRLEKSA